MTESNEECSVKEQEQLTRMTTRPATKRVEGTAAERSRKLTDRQKPAA